MGDKKEWPKVMVEELYYGKRELWDVTSNNYENRV